MSDKKVVQISGTAKAGASASTGGAKPQTVQISGTARQPGKHGLVEGLVGELNIIEDYWRGLKVLTAGFANKPGAGVLLIRFAAKTWILAGRTPQGFLQTCENWISQYEKSEGGDLTDND